MMEIEFIPKQQSRVIDQFKINDAVNFNILNEFSDYPSKKKVLVLVIGKLN